MQDFPIEYEYVDGSVIASEYAGHQMPIPPTWVREWAKVPSKVQYACLANELEDFYRGYREPLVNYVKGWVQHVQYGHGLLIAGPLPSRMRTWMAAAVVNEIVMRFGPRMGLACAWFSIPRGLPLVLDARARQSEEYLGMRNRFLNAKLLLVEGLDAVSRLDDGKWFIEMLYDHRYNFQLPTITTATGEVEWRYWERKLGSALANAVKDCTPYVIEC